MRRSFKQTLDAAGKKPATRTEEAVCETLAGGQLNSLRLKDRAVMIDRDFRFFSRIVSIAHSAPPPMIGFGQRHSYHRRLGCGTGSRSTPQP
jgi:hypothetical protein